MKTNKMENIEWKKSQIDYDALNKLTPKTLKLEETKTPENQSKNGKKGGKAAMAKEGHKEKLQDSLDKWKEENPEEYSKKQSKAAKVAGKKNVESGHWDKVREAKKQWELDNPELARQIRSDNGKRMNENTDPEFRKQHNTKVGRKIYIMSDGFVLKNPFVKSKYEKKHPGTSVFDSFVEGDDQYEYYNNIIIERKEQERLDKLKPKTCQYCGNEFAPRGLKPHQRHCSK